MKTNKNYYIGKFNARQDGLREDVLDYLFSFLRRRIDINEGIPVENIRRHCEQTLKKEVPMDVMIGALLYDRYAVTNIHGQWVAGISWNSPIGRMLNHERIDRPTLKALHGWYGDLIDPTTGRLYDQQ